MTLKKPEWLQALEAQSWQAELIASGLAIYGSFTLGPYLENLTAWAALRFNDRVLNILYFLFIYLFAAQAVLVISFISHLALRILWAGILGLSSVYPEGINMKSTSYAEHFKLKLKEEFPDLSEYSLTLDKTCSMIFSILCALVIVLLSTSFWILIYILLSELCLRFIPVSVFNYIQYSLLTFIFVFSLLSALLASGPWKNTKLAKKYAYPFNQNNNKIIMLVGYKSFNYITQTIRSNVTSKLFFIGMMLIMFISMSTTIPRLKEMVPFYQSDVFVHFKGEASTVDKRSYADQHTDAKVLLPFIQSEIITDNFLNLYIPLFVREKEVFDAQGEDFDWNNNLNNVENRTLRNTLKVKKATRYYALRIDGRIIENTEYQYRRTLHNNTEGFQVFIDLSEVSTGNHILTIKSKYSDGDDNYYTRSIPFYKTN